MFSMSWLHCRTLALHVGKNVRLAARLGILLIDEYLCLLMIVSRLGIFIRPPAASRD